MMKKITLFLFPLLATLALAQNVTLTATVTSAQYAQPYANGSFFINLVDANGNDLSSAQVNIGSIAVTIPIIRGSLDSFGSLSVQITPNSIITSPQGTQYKINVCSQNPLNYPPSGTIPPMVCFTAPPIAIPSSTNLSTYLSALAPNIQSTGGGGGGLPVGCNPLSPNGVQCVGTVSGGNVQAGTAITGNYFWMNNLSPFPATWGMDVTTPTTALQSIDSALPSEFASKSAASPAAGTFTVENLVQKCETFAGATADVKLTNCLAAVPSGGTADARGFGATTQSLAATVAVPTAVSLLCAESTKFQPASSSLTMFSLKAGSKISGCWGDVSNQTAFSGRVYSWTDNYSDIFAVGSAGIHAYAEHLKATATNGGSPISTGDALYFGATGNNQVTGIVLNDFSVSGFQNCLHLQTTGTGNAFVNSLMIQNGNCLYPVNGLNLDNTNTGTGTIDGNQILNVECQYGTGITVACITVPNTGVTRNNLIQNFVSWDTTTAISSVSSANIQNNLYQGRFDGTITDPNSTDSILALDYVHNSALFGANVTVGAAGYSIRTSGHGISGPNASQQINDDSTSTGGWNIVVGSSSTYGLRGFAGASQVWQIDKSGNFFVGNGTNIVYRCTTAGTLPVGALTTATGNCGASTDTGMRTK